MDVFTRPLYKDLFVDSLNYCICHKGLKVYSWVLMTNHAHLVIGTEGEKMEFILRDLKKFTATRIFELISNGGFESRDWIRPMMEFEGRKNPNNKVFQFWQHTNHPIELWKDEMIIQRINYIHQNPVRAGFVSKAEDWLYGSAKDYIGERGLVTVEVLPELMIKV
ncbi:MAG: transposase [Flavobacteriales bacterium]|nr:transposase [Flavobacteriales bacterium]